MRILILIILLTSLLALPGCTMVAKHLLDTISGSGVSVDAQIGDRTASLGNTVGDIEGENVALETGNRAFEGNAENVTITDTNYLGMGLFVLGGLLVGLIMGIFIDRKRIGL